MLKLYEIPGRGFFWYDPADRLLPESAKLVVSKPAKKAEEKALEPKNKAVKASNK